MRHLYSSNRSHLALSAKLKQWTREVEQEWLDHIASSLPSEECYITEDLVSNRKALGLDFSLLKDNEKYAVSFDNQGNISYSIVN